jgi:hypothetical protein
MFGFNKIFDTQDGGSCRQSRRGWGLTPLVVPRGSDKLARRWCRLDVASVEAL